MPLLLTDYIPREVIDDSGEGDREAFTKEFLNTMPATKALDVENSTYSDLVYFFTGVKRFVMANELVSTIPNDAVVEILPSFGDSVLDENNGAVVLPSLEGGL